ncbi:MAG TPA: TldD/PmbA family protein [Actinomycetota bacterium]|nr:TldD/PmbA family protein [Actinomycetota bacterium]
MIDVARQAVEAARTAGADYADARMVTEEEESLSVRNQEMEGIDRSLSQGLGIRVLTGGYWGFAATARLDDAEIARTASLAVEIARAASRLPMEPVRLAEVEPVTASWSTPVREDPFLVELDEKVALLMEASRRGQGVAGVAFSEALMDLYRRRTFFASSEGAAIEQTVVHSGGGLEITAIEASEMQQRSFPNSFRGHILAAGYEHIRTLGLTEEAERVASEAVRLLSAPDCPSQETTLVLDASQVILQMHESIGHPVELDRVLGMEEAYAGTSFLSPDDRGKLRYGSDKVTVVADATLPGGLGTFAFDDEGVPAERVVLIEDGVFERFISSRETAPVIGERSSGSMRADGWQSLPLIRMTNINLEPREGTLGEIIGDTKDGIYMDTNQSWSIDDKRVNFQFGCEAAWRIKDGKLTEMYRNPNYTGITTEFWGSCDAVGGRDEWKVYGTPNCGKGQPSQVARVGHAAPPARFRGVRVGVR